MAQNELSHYFHLNQKINLVRIILIYQNLDRQDLLWIILPLAKILFFLLYLQLFLRSYLKNYRLIYRNHHCHHLIQKKKRFSFNYFFFVSLTIYRKTHCYQNLMNLILVFFFLELPIQWFFKLSNCFYHFFHLRLMKLLVF